MFIPYYSFLILILVHLSCIFPGFYFSFSFPPFLIKKQKKNVSYFPFMLIPSSSFLNLILVYFNIFHHCYLVLLFFFLIKNKRKKRVYLIPVSLSYISFLNLVLASLSSLITFIYFSYLSIDF